MNPYLPVVLMLFGGIFTTAAIILLSRLFSRSNPTPEKLSPYECGVEPIELPKGKLSVKFYVVALVFIIFDIETVFMYPWAVHFRELGMAGFVEMLIFLFVLAFGLAYIWKNKVLEWQ